MLLFLVVVFVLSCAAMVLLLYIKHWELSTGRMLFASARPHVAAFAHRALVSIEHHLPSALKRASVRIFRWLRAHARNIVARALIAVEHTLENVLTTLRHGLS